MVLYTFLIALLCIPSVVFGHSYVRVIDATGGQYSYNREPVHGTVRVIDATGGSTSLSSLSVTRFSPEEEATLSTFQDTQTRFSLDQGSVSRSLSDASGRGAIFRNVRLSSRSDKFRPFGDDNSGSVFRDANYVSPSGNRPFDDPPAGDFVLSDDIPRSPRPDPPCAYTPRDIPSVFGPIPDIRRCGMFGPVPTLSEYLPRGSDQ